METTTPINTHSTSTPLNDEDERVWIVAEHPDVPTFLFRLASAYLFIVGFLGFVSNLAVGWAFIRNKKLQTPFNSILMNMILAELAIVFCGTPIEFVASVMQGWKLGKIPCKIAGFLVTHGGMLSIFTLAALSLQRWITVTRMGSNLQQNKQTAGITLVIIWTLASACSLPPLFGWAQYVPESSGLICAPSWESADNLSYNIYLFVLGFFCPLGIILTTSVLVIKRLRKNMRQMQSLNVKQSAEKRENKVTLMVLAMIVAYLFCWSPYAFTSLYQICGGFVSTKATLFPSLLSKSSIFLNPIIYAVMNSQFRSALSFGCLRRGSTRRRHRKTTMEANEKIYCTKATRQLDLSKDHDDEKDGEEDGQSSTVIETLFSARKNAHKNSITDQKVSSSHLEENETSSEILKASFTLEIRADIENDPEEE